ncbi:ASCH domain protein [Variovorax sp. PBS-H4]|uniref:ASCH domain-containing protein n=1 Tax=Variovorax sp. PBS-H4 TaxID=434008 RepID=UPI0013164492|nr:ASCH domain-containing protein [Variovorax sp. PBS-H4]VTU38484.1 ASCH domain protein [Variovorax sp. PBS-H4]
MKAISIRQPWAWLIVHAGKDIENRTWPTRYRGPVLIHAAKGMTREEWEDAWTFAQGTGASPKAIAAGITRDTIERGGFVGIAELIDCVMPARRVSSWHMDGCFGFKLANVRPLPFTPYKGALGLFDVPQGIVTLPEPAHG